jgi:hypothetical protein
LKTEGKRQCAEDTCGKKHHRDHQPDNVEDACPPKRIVDTRIVQNDREYRKDKRQEMQVVSDRNPSGNNNPAGDQVPHVMFLKKTDYFEGEEESGCDRYQVDNEQEPSKEQLMFTNHFKSLLYLENTTIIIILSYRNSSLLLFQPTNSFALVLCHA